MGIVRVDLIMAPLTSNSEDTGVQSPLRQELDALLADCVRRDASDLHLAPGLPPFFRLHGVLDPGENAVLLPALKIEGMAQVLIGPAANLDRTGSVDGAITAADGTRFRFNVFRRQGQLAIALRRLEDRFRTLGELGMPESLYELCALPDGLVVICGPTGAGKSTTLASLLDRINQTRRCHIVTIEDPIEYLHAPGKSLVNQRQVGADASSFHDALVASLRQDPDVILVGEIRDLATIRTAITAAETGHLVFTTVHAGDCVGAVERLVSVFPADEQAGIRRQLALVARAFVAQHLIIADGSAHSLATPKRRERLAASEILMVTPAVGNLIATAKSNQIYSAMETGTNQGMQTLEQDLARLWVSNAISETAAITMARNPAILRDRAALLRKSGTRMPGVGR